MPEWPPLIGLSLSSAAQSMMRTERIHPAPGVSDLCLEWVLAWRAVDGGMPPAVGGIIARALCLAGAVLFLGQAEEPETTTSAWRPLIGHRGWTRTVRNTPIVRWLRPRWARFPVVFTDAPAKAIELFDMAYFGWSGEAQAVFPFESRASPPEFDWSALRAALDADVASKDMFAAVPRPAAFMVPGVDGDAAHLFYFSDAWRSSFEQALAAECAAVDVQLSRR